MCYGLVNFCTDDTGAVTVDWVVLTAAIVGLGLVVLIPFGISADSAARTTADFILSVPVGAGD